MSVLLVYLAILLVLAALFFGLSRQLGRPSGWFGRRVMGRLLNRGNQRFLCNAVEVSEKDRGELTVIGRAL